MSQKHLPEQQTDTLSLRFFPSPSVQTSYPTKKWLVSSQLPKAMDAARRNTCSYVECNCACK